MWLFSQLLLLTHSVLPQEVVTDTVPLISPSRLPLFYVHIPPYSSQMKLVYTLIL